jgi:predicted nucleic acid-binding protein
MTNRELTMLVDTNVWIDRFLPGRPGHAVARSFLESCVDEGVTLLYPLRALQDVFWQVVVSNKKWVREGGGELSEGHAKAINGFAWDCIDSMSIVGTPVGADASDVWYARHLREIHHDFEDDMVLAAADRAKPDYVVTSDRKLIQKATVAALTPEDALKVLDMNRKLAE